LRRARRDQRDSHDLQVRGAAAGQDRVIHGGLLNVLRMWSEGTEALGGNG
jgi:hypothetical protein